MRREKKLYLTLSLLLVFALSGEQPKLKEDLQRTATGLMRLLQVDEITYVCKPIVESANRGFRTLANRLLH